MSMSFYATPERRLKTARPFAPYCRDSQHATPSVGAGSRNRSGGSMTSFKPWPLSEPSCDLWVDRATLHFLLRLQRSTTRDA